MTAIATERVILVDRYLEAFDFVMHSGFADEIHELEVRRTWDIDEQTFLREFAFVVLVSGFRYSTVEGLFGQFVEAFNGLRNASELVPRLDIVRVQALSVFNHPRKVGAVCSVIEDVARIGFESHFRHLLADWSLIEGYECVGPATSLHLARNLGLDVAKPDRHLMRLATGVGYSVADLTASLAAATGDRVSVVDGVLWRFATLRRDIVDFFTARE